MSRLTGQKGIDVAIRALASLPGDVVLVVLGEGPDREALERLARELGVEGACSCSGAFPTSPPGSAAPTSSSTRHAGRASASRVLEAMLAGLPVVATRRQLAARARRRRRDRAARRGRTTRRRSRLRSSSALEQPALGEAGRARAHAEFSVARMADRHVALYERVTGVRRATEPTVSSE